MTPLTTEQVEEILAGCEGATPGPWAVRYDEIGRGPDTRLVAFLEGPDEILTGVIDEEPGSMGSPILEHIARLDPQTVSSLATELLALRKRVGELEGAGWQMLDLLKRVVTVLDAEVFDELAADTLLRDAVTFLYTAKEPNGWQDIATAPRDGTHVHVAFAGTSSPQTVAHWFGPPDLPGLRAGNWYLSVQQLEGPPVHPTHWRTLPALPTPKEPS